MIVIGYAALLIGLAVNAAAHGTTNSGSDKLKVFAISNGESDGLTRCLRSAKLFHFDLKVLRSDPVNPSGKAGIMKAEVDSLCSSEKKLNDDTLLMFVDADETVFVGAPIEIVDSFKKFNAGVVFSADINILDETLASQYPPVEDEYPYLFSGGFIGSSKTMCELFATEVSKVEDDQLLFTKLYLDESVRSKYNIKLDGRANIFHSMYGASKDVMVKYLSSHSFLLNTRYETTPKVLVANGAKVELNRMADYVPDGWSQSAGCQFCKEDRIELGGIPASELPLVVFAVFIEFPTPFLPSMLNRLFHINYPLKRIVLAIHNGVPYHAHNVTEFLSKSIIADFHSVELILSEKYTVEGDVRNQVIDLCDRVGCKYVFAIDSLARIDNPNTLRHLIEQNRPVIAPILRRPNEMWSNFWGSVSNAGYYSRSSDYMDILNGVKRGIWNVPCINNAILFRADYLPRVRNAWFSNRFEPDIAFCAFMREKGHFMYIDNQNHYGHLVNPDNYNISRTHPELWELNSNRLDWEELYIDTAYWKIGTNKNNGVASSAKAYESPCNDVYLYPLVTETFCRHLIDETEHFGQWSSGKHDDERLAGGYENVPTVDIHMRQISYHQEWLQILKNYVSPLAKFSFQGYEPESRASMAFVVRYHPREQDRLHPHFDSSTWTAVIGLTRPGIDFEGGGTRFVRQNCSMTEQPRGSVIVFPGRLTHWHEGLPVTKGTRYIAVTFVDP